MSDSLLTVITPSYRNDYELVTDLCKSMDQFISIPFKHLLIVPDADLKLFSNLKSENRCILSEENLLHPYSFHKIPFPRRIRIPGIIDMRFRAQWYGCGVGRINGWVIQQLIKLSAPQLTESEIILFIDSDNIFFRPLGLDQLYSAGQIKLARKIIRSDMHSHFQWHANALSLLGVSDFTGVHFNYVGNLIVWKRAAVLALQRRIADVAGLDWRVAVARKKAISEYILYGLYCEMVATEDSHHVFSTPDLTCSFWTSSEAELQISEMAKKLQSSHVALHIQSTIAMPIEKRQALIEKLIALMPAAAS